MIVTRTPRLVSVIIPTYNRADYLAEAIRSVQAQTHPDVEIIVADDGSTDNTAEVVARFGEDVTYLPLPHRGQPAATRNEGLRAAKGEFVAFLDSDDLFLPGKLALQLAACEAHPETGLVYSDGHYFHHDPQQPTGHLLDGFPTPSGDVFAELLRGNFLVSPGQVLIRQECFDAVGVFDEDPALWVSEDYDLWLRIAACYPVVYASGYVAAVRRHGQGLSADAATLRARALLVLEKTQATYPDLVRRHSAAFNEGCARSHGAIALARFRQRRVMAALRHGACALRYGLGTPGYGTQALARWILRRRVRRTGALP